MTTQAMKFTNHAEYSNLGLVIRVSHCTFPLRSVQQQAVAVSYQDQASHRRSLTTSLEKKYECLNLASVVCCAHRCNFLFI